MKSQILITSLVVLLSAAPSMAEELFNGKDLTGWKGNPELWRVEDGCIVGETTEEKKTSGNTFLIWEGGEVEDFEISLKARVTGNNSGLQYRSKVVDADKWVVGGYQMDMHPNSNYFGMLYEEKGRGILAQRGQKVTLKADAKPEVTGEVDASKKLDLSEWNEFKVIARGNKLIHMVNGDIVAEITDEDEGKRASSGIIALQLHAGPAMRIEAKDIVLTKFDSKEK